MNQHRLDLGTFVPQVTLFDYQETGVAAVLDAFASGIRRPAMAVATGGGKTIMFSAVAERSQERTLVIAHRKEIIDQAVEKMGLLIDPRDIGVVMGSRDEFDRPVVIASIQSIASRDRLERLGDFGLIVGDEAHHFASPSYVTAIGRLGAGPDGDVKLLGVSATWDRLDGVGLDKVFDRIVYEKRVEELIAEGYLADVAALVVDTVLDLQGVGFSEGDYNSEDLGRAISRSHIPEAAAAAVARYAPDRKTLMFAPTVATAQEYADALNAVGIRAAMVHGGTPKREREDLIADMRAGRIQALTNCGVFTEGTDIPIVDCVAMGRPTRSRALYQQMVGRGLRKYPGKADCLVLDLVALTGEHEFQTWADLMGLDGAKVKVSTRASLQQKLLDQGELEGDGIHEQPATLESRVAAKIRKQEARSVDIIDRSRMVWSTIDEATWSLSAGELGQVMIQGDKFGTFSVVRYGKERGDVEQIATGLDVGYAQGIAEQRVAAAVPAALVNPKSSWRRPGVPASEAQLAALAKWRIAFDPAAPPSKGEASDMLEAAIARAKLRNAGGSRHANRQSVT